MNLIEVDGYYLLPNKNKKTYYSSFKADYDPIEKKRLFTFLLLRLKPNKNNLEKSINQIEDLLEGLRLGYTSNNKYLLYSNFKKYIPENYLSECVVYNNLLT